MPKSVLTQKCDDVINTQQARRSEWNKTRDLLGFNTEPSILKTHLCGSQFDLQLTRRENFISNLRWNMSVLHQIVLNVWLDSQFNKAIDLIVGYPACPRYKILKDRYYWQLSNIK